MSSSCAQWRGEIGAYIVGALDGKTRDRVTHHIAACAGCRADYDEIVPVRDWLGLLDLLAAEPEPGPAEQLGRPLQRFFREGPSPAARTGNALAPRPRRESGTQFPAQPAGRLPLIRPQTRRWLPAAGAAVAAAAATVSVLVSAGTSARTFRAVDKTTGVSGHAQLHDTPTGTRIDLTASGLPGNGRCILVAVSRGGTDIAGSWDATYDGSARISGTTAYPASQLTALRIESDTGRLLLSVRV